MTSNQPSWTLSTRKEAVEQWGGAIAERFSQIEADILLMNELELATHFKPSPTDYYIRKSFWKVTKEMESGADVLVGDIYGGICTTQQFYDKILKNKYRTAWIFTPFEKSEEMFEEFFYAMFMKMRSEMLAMPITDKTIGPFVKLLESLANRVVGPVPHKIEQKSMNVNVAAEMKDVTGADVEDKFTELRSKMEALPASAKNVENPE